MCGTHEDILIAGACLNATTAGLLSRAVYSREFLNEDDFYGAVFFDKLLSLDKTYDFIEKIEEKLDYSDSLCCDNNMTELTGVKEVNKIAMDYGISNIHFIKPGVGETMRALIRKSPDVILVKDISNKYIEYIKDVANEKNIAIEKYPLQRYNVCSIFKDANSDVL